MDDCLTDSVLVNKGFCVFYTVECVIFHPKVHCFAAAVAGTAFTGENRRPPLRNLSYVVTWHFVKRRVAILVYKLVPLEPQS